MSGHPPSPPEDRPVIQTGRFINSGWNLILFSSITTAAGSIVEGSPLRAVRLTLIKDDAPGPF